MRRLWGWLREIDTNRSVALAALCISVCALYVSIQEMRLLRQQQKVDVYPHLTLTRGYSQEGFSVWVKNSGVGLARINSVQLTDGERYFRDWPSLIAHYLPDSLAFGYEKISANTINGKVITAGEEVRLFGVNWHPGVRDFEKTTREKLVLRICYSSLLDDHWLLENDERTAREGPCPIIPDREMQ